MSYQNVVRPLMQFLSFFEYPRILEIGVDKGQTTLPLCHNMTMLDRTWLYEGVDIEIRDEVIQSLSAMSNVFCNAMEPDIPIQPNTIFYQINSLDYLEEAVKKEIKYNLVLLDGDHNYYTVRKELDLIQNLTLPSTIIVCDDYYTDWAHEDLYYSEREDYKDNDLATKRQKTEKVGVATAVDDFVRDSNGKWNILPGLGAIPDYCILYQPENVIDMQYFKPPEIIMASLGILEIYFNNAKCPEVKERLMINLDYSYTRSGPRDPRQERLKQHLR